MSRAQGALARRDGVGIAELRARAHQLHLALGQVCGIDPVEAVDIRLPVVFQARPVVTQDLQPEAVAGCIPERPAEFGGVPHELLGYAADVHARAPQRPGLHQRHPGTVLGGTLRGGQPPAPATDHHQVVLLAHRPSRRQKPMLYEGQAHEVPVRLAPADPAA